MGIPLCLSQVGVRAHVSKLVSKDEVGELRRQGCMRYDSVNVSGNEERREGDGTGTGPLWFVHYSDPVEITDRHTF